MGNSNTAVWSRVVQHQGEQFFTKLGLPFGYLVSGNMLIVNRTDRQLSRSNFEKLLGRLPIAGPGDISNDVQGSSYVWAILHDARVRGADW